jgi:hypothetical protein
VRTLDGEDVVVIGETAIASGDLGSGGCGEDREEEEN